MHGYVGGRGTIASEIHFHDMLTLVQPLESSDKKILGIGTGKSISPVSNQPWLRIQQAVWIGGYCCFGFLFGCPVPYLDH